MRNAKRVPATILRDKRSMWRESCCHDLACLAMWPCCAYSSSDDDEHNADNEALLLFGHAIVAPVLLSCLSAVDELSFALTCRFALDIFTIFQLDYPEAFEELNSLDLELEELAWALQAAAYHSGGGFSAWAACFSGETIVKAPEA